MNKKKILFMVYNMNLGGTEKSLLNLINILPLDYEITLLLLVKNGSLLKEIPNRVKIIEVKNSVEINNFIQKDPISSTFDFLKRKKIKKACHTIFNYIRWKMSKDYVHNFKSIDYLIKSINEQFDIAIAYAGPYDFISYFISNKINAKKKIQWIHFDISKIGFNKQTSRKLYTNFDEIKVVSKDVKKQFLNVLPELDHKVAVFHNIIPEKIITELAKKENVYDSTYNGIKIVTVGRLSKEKGHELFIPAMRKLIDENHNVKWYLVGDGIHKEELKKMVEDLSLENHIIFLGSKTNPYPYIDQASIYLQPSYYEGHCVTILEAKVFNKPIITTNFSGAKEEIESGVNGLVVDISTEGLYSGMKLILDDEELRTTFQRNLKQSNLNKKTDTLNLI